MSVTLAPDSQLEDLGYQPSLNRQLPLGSLLVYGLLFFVPMAPVAVFGPVVNRSGGVPVLVYLVAAAVMGLSAISYREMALRFPVAGSVYGYTRFSLGRVPGFIAGWLILLDYILLPALLTVLSAVALAHIWPSVPTGIFAVVFVLASMALNLQGVTVTTRVGLVLLAIQVATIAVFLVCVGQGLASGEVAWSWHALWRPGTSWASVASAVSIAALSYLGFDAVATLNEEARGGGRAVGIVTLLLVGLLAVLFGVQVLAAGLVSDTMHFAPGGATDRAFYHTVDQVCPGWFTSIFTVVNAFVAIFACLVVAHSSTARLVFAMARDVGGHRCRRHRHRHPGCHLRLPRRDDDDPGDLRCAVELRLPARRRHSPVCFQGGLTQVGASPRRPDPGCPNLAHRPGEDRGDDADRGPQLARGWCHRCDHHSGTQITSGSEIDFTSGVIPPRRGGSSPTPRTPRRECSRER